MAVAENENNWFLHYLLALEYLRIQQPDRMLEELQESARLNPRYARTQYCLGKAWDDKAVTTRRCVIIQKAIKLDPGWGSPWYNCGVLYFKTGELDEAISHFQKAAQCNRAAASKCRIERERYKAPSTLPGVSSSAGWRRT